LKRRAAKTGVLINIFIRSEQRNSQGDDFFTKQFASKYSIPANNKLRLIDFEHILQKTGYFF